MKILYKKIGRRILGLTHKHPGLFKSIMIETFGHCNRSCAFCFNSKNFLNREEGIMKIDIWNKIIDELHDLGFTGRIAPHFYGEPLLDKRLEDMIQYARKKNPFTTIRFSTNGDKLNEEKLKKLMRAGLDEMLVTNYDEKENELLKNLSIKYPKTVLYRNSSDIRMVNRAGGLDMDSKDRKYTPCLRPSHQMVINWKGNVVLCCNDYYERHIYGNVQDKKLIDIWYGPELSRDRAALNKENGRQAFPLCTGCDL